MIWHSTPAADALDKYKTDPKVGVTSGKAAERTQKYGKNILIEKEKKEEEEAVKVEIPKAENIGTNLGDLFKDIKL